MASVVHGQQVGDHEYGGEEGMPGVVVMLVILLLMLVSDLFEEQMEMPRIVVLFSVKMVVMSALWL